MKPLVSIIIPCFNQLGYTRTCLQSILRYSSRPFELIVIDNGSSDHTARYLNNFRRTAARTPNLSLKRYFPIFHSDNIGVAAALNQGIRLARGAYLCYLNNDIIVTRQWLEGLIRCAESQKRIGVVGSATNAESHDLRLWSGRNKGRNMRKIQRIASLAGLLPVRYEDAPYVYGFCMFIKREVINAIGLFDERFYPCFGEDVDFCLRAKQAGFRLVTAPDVFIFHFGQKATTGKKFDENYKGLPAVVKKNTALFLEKWGNAGKPMVRWMKKWPGRYLQFEL